MKTIRIYYLAMHELLRRIEIETERANNGSTIAYKRLNLLKGQEKQLHEMILAEEKM